MTRATKKQGQPEPARQLPEAPPVDFEQLALHAREARISKCEEEILAAVNPILKRHRCRMGTIQTWIDGKPGPVSVKVFALE